MLNKYKSDRGVYYDLDKSPYEYKDEYGNVYKFSSLKKLSMFEVKVKMKEQQFQKEIDNLAKMGYDLSFDYLTNKKNLPKIVYKQMIYK